MADSGLTKRALAASMKELMSQRPFAKVNVGDICDHCGMNRKSFYYHFRDKYDLVNWIFQTEFISVMRNRPFSNAWEVFTSLCQYFYDNRLFYNNALSVEGQNSFTEYFQSTVKPYIRAAIQELYPTDREQMDFTSQFYTDAITLSLRRWLADRDCVSAEVYTQRLYNGIRPVL